MISPMIAAKAYAAMQNQGVSPSAATPVAAGPSFAEVLKSTIGDAVSSSRQAETQMQAHSAGRADLINVVTSVAQAESSLETVMAVRDQVISAYQEIMRMPI